MPALQVFVKEAKNLQRIAERRLQKAVADLADRDAAASQAGPLSRAQVGKPDFNLTSCPLSRVKSRSARAVGRSAGPLAISRQVKPQHLDFMGIQPAVVPAAPYLLTVKNVSTLAVSLHKPSCS